jgi:hypothetical protein
MTDALSFSTFKPIFRNSVLNYAKIASFYALFNLSFNKSSSQMMQHNVRKLKPDEVIQKCKNKTKFNYNAVIQRVLS